MKKSFSFQASVWLYPGKAGWHFITVPTDTSKEIDFYFAHKKRGWGSLRVRVTVATTSWQTSIFPDKKSDTYLLPLKASIRKQLDMKEGDACSLKLEVLE